MREISSRSRHDVFVTRRVRTTICLPSICVLLCSFIFVGCASVTAGNSAAGPTPSVVSVVPAEIDFKSVVVGQKNSQTLRITNNGTKNVYFSSLHVTGSNFSLLSAKAPVVLAPGETLNMNVVFAPAKEAEEVGAMTIASPELRAPLRIPLIGSGEKPVRALQVSPSNINFGTHTVNSSAFQTVTLANTGNISLTVNSVTVSGAGYAITGLSPGVSLLAQQRLEFQVWFHPSITGNSAATVTANVPSLSSPLKLAVSGSATSASVTSPSSSSTHSVTLDWNPSSSSVAGYHVYRGSRSGGPYGRINNSIVDSLNYQDANVQSGSHYFYVVTAQDTDGVESPFSNEVIADIPNP